MKPLSTLRKIYFLTSLLLTAVVSHAQICAHPSDTMYSMSTTGVIYPVNLFTAGNGPSLDSLQAKPGVPPLNANGMGYSSLNGKFYYFERCNTGTTPNQTFVSYDPATKKVDSLAISTGANNINNNKIRSGCVNNAGTGYYTIDPAYIGTTAALHYYNIATDTWTRITTNFDSLGGAVNSLNSTFDGLNSGDMAFDGLGNLWILCSNSSKFGLFKVPAPVPTTAVTRISNIVQVIPPTTNVPSPGFSVTGLAFNSTGSLYLSTGTGDNKLFRLSGGSAASLTLVGTFPKDDIGGDLTSCSSPISVLATTPWQNFTAVLHNGIELRWQAAEGNGISGYAIEYSYDGSHWDNHGFVTRTTSIGAGTNSYYFVDQQYGTGNNYYRIVQYTTAGDKMMSPVRFVNTKATHAVYAGPNPAKDVLYIYSSNTTVNYMAQVFDRSGRLLQTAVVPQGQQTINIAGLPKGSYILRLLAAEDNAATSLQFIKW